MADKELQYRLVIKDDGTPVLRKVSAEVDNIGKSTKRWGEEQEYSLKKTTKAVKETTEETGQFGRAMERLNRTIIAFVGVWAFQEILSGFRKLIETAIEYNQTMEDSRLGIAAILTAQGTFTDAQGKTLKGQEALTAAQLESLGITKQLQLDNLKTAATYEQLVKAYQQTLSPGLDVGLGLDQIRQYTLAMVQAASTMKINLDMMAEETRSMLRGTITPRNTIIATNLGIRPEDIAKYKGDAKGLFDFLMEKLEAFNAAGAAVQNTFSGILSNTKDAASIALGEGFEPLFEYLKEELKKVQAMFIEFNENGPQVKPEALAAFRELSGYIIDIIEIAKDIGRFFASWMPTLRLVGNIISFILWTMKPMAIGAEALLNSFNAYAAALNNCFDWLMKMGEKLGLIARTMPAKGSVIDKLGGQTGVPVDYSGQPDVRARFKPGPGSGPTEEERKRGEQWLAIQRDLTAELDKSAEGASKWEKELINISKKYEDVLAKAKGIDGLPVNRVWMDKWKADMIASVYADREAEAKKANYKALEEERKLQYDVQQIYRRGSNEIFNIERDTLMKINKLRVEAGTMPEEDTLRMERDTRLENLRFEEQMIDSQIKFMGTQEGVYLNLKDQVKLYEDKRKIQAEINGTQEYFNELLFTTYRWESERAKVTAQYKGQIAEITGDWELSKKVELELLEIETKRAIQFGGLTEEAKRYAQTVLELRKKEIEAARTLNAVELANIGLAKYGWQSNQDLVNMYQSTLPNAIDHTFGSLTDLFMGLADGTIETKNAFQSLFLTLARGFEKLALDLAMTIIKVQILKALGYGIGSGLTGGGTGIAGGANIDWTQGGGGTYGHDGGVVRRFHSGGSIGPDEVPAILQTGEIVLSRQDVAAIKSAKGAGVTAVQPIINVYNNNGSQINTQTRNSNEGVQIDVIVDQMVASKIGKFGSSSNKALRQNFGAKQTLVNR